MFIAICVGIVVFAIYVAACLTGKMLHDADIEHRKLLERLKKEFDHREIG